jgi:DNA-directed RNA polymerase subunit M/transcription elongation factor TFIIS
MSLFCNICNNLLEKITDYNKFYFKCEQCQKNYNITELDTLQYEESKGSNLMNSQILLLHASRDPVNPKIEKKCLKCNYNYARQVRAGKDLRLIDTCIKCNHQELYEINQ